MRKRVLFTCLAISIVGILIFFAFSIGVQYRALTSNGVETVTRGELFTDTLPSLGWTLLIDIILCLFVAFVASNLILRPAEELAKKALFNEKVQTKHTELQPLADCEIHSLAAVIDDADAHNDSVILQ